MCCNYSLIILLDVSGVIPLRAVIMHHFVNICYDIEVSVALWVITPIGVYPFSEEYLIYYESNVIEIFFQEL